MRPQESLGRTHPCLEPQSLAYYWGGPPPPDHRLLPACLATEGRRLGAGSPGAQEPSQRGEPHSPRPHPPPSGGGLQLPAPSSPPRPWPHARQLDPSQQLAGAGKARPPGLAGGWRWRRAGGRAAAAALRGLRLARAPPRGHVSRTNWPFLSRPSR